VVFSLKLRSDCFVFEGGFGGGAVASGLVEVAFVAAGEAVVV